MSNSIKKSMLITGEPRPSWGRRLIAFFGRNLARGVRRLAIASYKEIEIPFSTDRYEQRLIIFIDIIGFSNYVLSNTEEAVKTLTSEFQRQVSEGAKYVIGEGYSYRPTFNFFSDTILVSYPLELFNERPAGEYCCARCNVPIDFKKSTLLIHASASIHNIQLHALKHGLLTRGCLTIDNIYHNQNTWFGPGIIEAHHYESKIAIYPRVILSRTALEYFFNEITHCQTGDFQRGDFTQDSDGYFYVDYMGWIHTKLGGDPPRGEFSNAHQEHFCNAHHELRDIITRNISILRDKKKYYELQKWQWLAIYFNRYSENVLRPIHGDGLASSIDV